MTGPTWGGCLEILDMHLRAGTYLLANEVYAGCVLLLETSEEMLGAEYVYRVLMGMGERGMLEQFGAVAVATPKAWDREVGQSVAERTRFAQDQRAAIAAPSRSTTLAYQRFSASTSATPTLRS